MKLNEITSATMQNVLDTFEVSHMLQMLRNGI